MTLAEGELSSQSQQIGDVALPTTAKTLTGAIAELDNEQTVFQNKFEPVQLTLSDYFTFANGITPADSRYNKIIKVAPHIAYIHIEGSGTITTGGFTIGTTTAKILQFMMINGRGTVSKVHHIGEVLLGPSTDAIFYTETQVTQFAGYGLILINE